MKQLSFFEPKEPPLNETPAMGEPVVSLPPRPALLSSEPEPPTLGAFLPPNFPRALSSLFAAMAIAEEEIEACKLRHPRQAERIHDAFQYLTPPPVLQEFDDTLYRAHARELLERVAFRVSLGPGTKAEVLAALSLASLAAPLSRVETRLAERNFRSLFPGEAEAVLGPAAEAPRITPDEYIAMQELETRLRRRVGQARKAGELPKAPSSARR